MWCHQGQRSKNCFTWFLASSIIKFDQQVFPVSLILVILTVLHPGSHRSAMVDLNSNSAIVLDGKSDYEFASRYHLGHSISKYWFAPLGSWMALFSLAKITLYISSNCYCYIFFKLLIDAPSGWFILPIHWKEYRDGSGFQENLKFCIMSFCAQ